MACGGCGKRRKIKNDVNIGNRVQLDRMGANVRKCELCGSKLRGLHKYDTELKRVVKVFYCIREGCRNSRGKK